MQRYISFVRSVLTCSGKGFVYMVTLIMFGLTMVFTYFFIRKLSKKKLLKDEIALKTESLDKEYMKLCGELSAKERKLCSDSTVTNGKYTVRHFDANHNESSSELRFLKNVNGELVCYQYRPVQKYKITDKKKFKVIPNLPGLILIKDVYPIKQIAFFREVGNVQYTTSVSGGGVNLAGAVVGGMVAGAAGAVIGSRQAVTSSTETHDDRKVVLKLNDGTEMVYNYKYYDYFIKLIPEKEYSFVMAKSQGI